MSKADIASLQDQFPGAIQHIERDAKFRITGEPQAEWLHTDVVPEAAKQRRARHLLAAANRVHRRQLPEEQEVNPTWNLDRIDQHGLPLDHLYRYGATGAGINV
jgi:hypothetical protein